MDKEAKTQLSKGITKQQAVSEKYTSSLTVLTAISKQTKAMVHVSEGTGTPRRPTKTGIERQRCSQQHKVACWWLHLSIYLILL